MPAGHLSERTPRRASQRGVQPAEAPAGERSPPRPVGERAIDRAIVFRDGTALARALNDRSEPRDLFDLWAGLCRFGVTFEEIAVGYRAKYGSPPGTWRLKRALAMKTDCERRLAYQIGNLPSFEEAYAAVRARVEE